MVESEIINKINLDFIGNIIESMKKDFFETDLFTYMAVNGGYELPFQSYLGKKIQDILDENYWVCTNKNKVDILIKNLKNKTNEIAIEVGHYQLQQSFSYNKKSISDISKKEKFDCPVFHIFLLSDIENITGNFDEILKYGSKKNATFEEYSEIYPKEKLEIIGKEKIYRNYKTNYRIFISGPF